jgi:signal transduction histidine kinase
MALRLRIFIRTVALLGVLIVACTVATVAFVVHQNRQYWDERCRQEVVFVADQAEDLVLWDDRVSLRELLDSLVASMDQLEYAFVEVDGVPYAHTFKTGVPAGLLNSARPSGEVSVFEFKDKEGAVFNDYSLQGERSGTSVHIGVSLYRVDRKAVGVINIVLLAGACLLLVSLIPGWFVSNAITREVNAANNALTRANRELETRVEERTSELRDANDALKEEMAGRKKLEKERDDFLSMIRHDMRTPLSVIYGYAEILYNAYAGRMDKEFSDMLGSVMKSAQSLTKMVEGMAEISRLETGRIELNYESVDLAGMVVIAHMDFARQASANGIKLGKDTPDVMPVIYADENYVKRALENLVANAVKYTPHGGEVTISCGTRGEGQGREAYVQVLDTGPGIPAEERERIFQKYYRARTAKGTDGKGLGLAIVKAVMDAHKGRVELDTEPGKGSTFRLVFPVPE